MATEPRFPIAAKCPIPARLTTGNTAKDGTGTVVTLFTAAASDSILNNIVIKPCETNSAAGVVRFFLNNGSTNATATNNILLSEEVNPIVTASETTTQTLILVSGIVDRIIPAGYRILASISVTPTNPVAVYAYGEDY
jgi:hypothetical protein